jgi:hypothetical protein
MVNLIKATLPTSTHDVRLTTASLEAMGELFMVMRQDIVPYVENLLPVIISNVFNSASVKKQETAIRTLGQLITAIGLVTKPYLQYPELLPKSLSLLKNSPWTLRREVLRTLGLLGALEPYKFGLIQEYLRKHEHAKYTDNSKGISGGLGQHYLGVGFTTDHGRTNENDIISTTTGGGILTQNNNPKEKDFDEKQRDRGDSEFSSHSSLQQTQQGNVILNKIYFYF